MDWKAVLKLLFLHISVNFTHIKLKSFIIFLKHRWHNEIHETFVEIVKKKRYPVSVFQGCLPPSVLVSDLLWSGTMTLLSTLSIWHSIMIMYLFTVTSTSILVITQLKKHRIRQLLHSVLQKLPCTFSMRWNALCCHEFLYHLTLLCGRFYFSIFLLFFPIIFHFRCEWLSNRNNLCRKLSHLWGTFFSSFWQVQQYITGHLEMNQFVILLG